MGEFGTTIKSLRKAKGFTQQYVADRVGVKKGYISSLEHSKVNPPVPEKVRKLAKVLGIDKVKLLLLAYIDKAPAEIRGILSKSVKALTEKSEVQPESTKEVAAAG
jgi:transcriptional regulator with XRE-family HTH domain